MSFSGEELMRQMEEAYVHDGPVLLKSHATAPSALPPANVLPPPSTGASTGVSTGVSTGSDIRRRMAELQGRIAPSIGRAAGYARLTDEPAEPLPALSEPRAPRAALGTALSPPHEESAALSLEREPSLTQSPFWPAEVAGANDESTAADRGAAPSSDEYDERWQA